MVAKVPCELAGTIQLACHGKKCLHRRARGSLIGRLATRFSPSRPFHARCSCIIHKRSEAWCSFEVDPAEFFSKGIYNLNFKVVSVAATSSKAAPDAALLSVIALMFLRVREWNKISLNVERTDAANTNQFVGIVLNDLNFGVLVVACELISLVTGSVVGGILLMVRSMARLDCGG